MALRELTAPVNGEAHVAFAFGDRLAWETRLAIPAPSGLVTPGWTAAADVPAGSPVRFHLHNHGQNSYGLLELSVTAAE